MLPSVGFWFLRHGETDWNAQGLSQGAVDVPLNAKGEAQAVRAGELLRESGIASIVASPLARARRTAEIVAAALNLSVRYDPDLREVTFAGKEGQPLGGWYDEWVSGTTTPPGAESFADLAVRAEAVVTRVLNSPPPVLVVSHGAFFRALRLAMRLLPNVRTPNAIPICCTPPPRSEPTRPWSLHAPHALSVIGPAGVSG